MTTLSQVIQLKQQPYPVVFSGPAVGIERTFPYLYNWVGNYTSDCSIANKRLAGYYVNPDQKPFTIENSVRFGLADGCFETAPSTQFPCWTDGYGCHTPPCRLNCNSTKTCLDTVGYR